MVGDERIYRPAHFTRSRGRLSFGSRQKHVLSFFSGSLSIGEKTQI